MALPIHCKFKKKKKTDFIHIFNDFIYVYSPRARADNPSLVPEKKIFERTDDGAKNDNSNFI